MPANLNVWIILKSIKQMPECNMTVIILAGTTVVPQNHRIFPNP